MFYFDIGNISLPEFMGGGYYHLWPIFNIADSAITVGIIVLLIFQGKFFKMDEEARGINSDDKKDASKTKSDESEEKSVDQTPSDSEVNP